VYHLVFAHLLGGWAAVTMLVLLARCGWLHFTAGSNDVFHQLSGDTCT